MPLGAWEGTQELPLPGVLRQPNPPEDRCSTIAAWVCDLLDHGNAVGQIIHQPTRESDTIIPWHATEVAVGRAASGAAVYTYRDVPYPADQVFHVKGMSGPNDLRGIGVMEAGLSTIQRLTAESAYASKAFNSGVPSGLLRVKDPDLQVGDDDDPAGYATAKGLKKAWQSSITSGDVAVLSELVDFTPLSWTPTDAQMVEARQMSIVYVANMYGLDPYWVGSAQTSAPYQNVQDAAVQLARFTLGFWISALEAQLSRLVLRGEARFNRDTILADPQSTRIDNAVKGPSTTNCAPRTASVCIISTPTMGDLSNWGSRPNYATTPPACTGSSGSSTKPRTGTTTSPSSGKAPYVNGRSGSNRCGTGPPAGQRFGSRRC
jgi:HK97 family phage portal protein